MFGPLEAAETLAAGVWTEDFRNDKTSLPNNAIYGRHLAHDVAYNTGFWAKAKEICVLLIPLSPANVWRYRGIKKSFLAFFDQKVAKGRYVALIPPLERISHTVFILPLEWILYVVIILLNMWISQLS